MKRQLSLAITSVSVILSFGPGLVAVNPAQAAIISYNLKAIVNSLSGPLVPTSGLTPGSIFTEGSFSYDDSSITGVGVESINLISLNVPRATPPFIPLNPGPVVYINGQFKGLSFISGTIPSIFSITEDSFAYQEICPLKCPLNGSQGTLLLGVNGNVTYTAIPEPLTILGAGTALGFGAFFKRKLAQKHQKT